MTDTHSSCRIVHSKKKICYLNIYQYLIMLSFHCEGSFCAQRSRQICDEIRVQGWGETGETGGFPPLLGAWENVGHKNKAMYQWINGLRVNLQENSIKLHIQWENLGFPVDFPLSQSIVGNARVSQMQSQISPPPEFSLRTSPVTCCTRSVLAYEQQIFGRLLWEL